MFHVQAIIPHYLLGNYVDSYQLVSVDLPLNGQMENTFLPHVSQSLVLGLDGEETVFDCEHGRFCAPHFITGPNDTVCHIKIYPGMNKLIIHFKPGGFFKIFQIPVHYFINQCRDAGEFLGPKINEIGQQLLECTTAAKAELLDNWLAGQVQVTKKNYRNIDAALGLIEKHNGNISIQELETATFTTKRTLERHFMEQVGMTPKIYSRLIRFKSVIQFLNSSHRIKWPRLAESFGYYDQSHFIHDFKTLTGSLPHDYFSLKNQFEKILQS